MELIVVVAIVALPGALAALIFRDHYRALVVFGVVAGYLVSAGFWVVAGFEGFEGAPWLAWLFQGFLFAGSWCIGLGIVAIAADLLTGRQT